ncbi:MAG: PepSY domain-containing protein [Ectothiorhodospiraceae bacterium]|nr:PepSY domain-containing protein [Chromatiales bacterium]MCP5154463.1 PepSY domain-containing protein [Ectothiorhodospiraceae bacterium]
MRTLITTTALLASLVAALPAAASDDARCGDAPRSQWMSEDALKARLVEQGYEVRNIKVEDGCYEAYAKDASGARLEMYINPTTGEVVRTKKED